jgi:cytoskeleton protein RodZ
LLIHSIASFTMTITIGQRLKAAREDQRLTLEKVFESTRIRVQYLQALEEDDLSAMPSPVQARGYLRNYAEFLGLDVQKLLDELRESSTQKPSEAVIGPADVPQGGGALSSDAVISIPDSPGIEETPLPIKPKAARRKKADPPPAGETAAPPKRRNRKEGMPTEEPDVEISPAEVEETIISSEVVSANPVQEPVKEPVVEEPSPVQEKPLPVLPEKPSQPPDIQSEPDMDDSNWQKWLNRLGAILAARNRRQTLVPNQEVAAPDAIPVEGVFSETQEPVPVPQGTESSAQIFVEIGRELRERRELLSLHLEEVERNTHVKAHYLDALERGAIDDLPSTVQTRGMLSNYATFLDLDVDTILLRFADALQARYRERNPQKPPGRKPGQPIVANLPPMRSFIAGDLVFGVGVVLLLVGFAIWGVSRVLTLQSQQNVDATAPSISQILLASPEALAETSTPTPESIGSFPGQPTITVVIPTLSGDVNVQVNLVAAERTYMRVTVDGEVAFEGRVVPGTAYPFDAQEQVEVLVGNGAAIRIVYNGRDLGLLGSFGQVVNNIYRVDEIVTPTGLPTATATITLTPTRTPVPSATSRFTATPVTPASSSTAVP